MSVLVIAPHPDDESIGCGGALALHAARGERVAVAFLTSGELGLRELPPAEAWRVREREAERAADVLGIAALRFLRQPDWYLGDAVPAAAAALRPVLDAERPHTVYVPHEEEWHPDHRAALPILERALAGDQRATVALRRYEVWTPLATCDHLEDVSATMVRKLRAVRCYASQLASFRYDRAVRGLNAFRGELGARCDYAEGFALGGRTPASDGAAGGLGASA